METIDFLLPFAAPASDVAQAFWRAEEWPALTPHVVGIDFHFEDEHTQVLTMKVESRGNRAEFRTVRCRQGDRIYYFQPVPPPFLRSHQGYWEFSATEAGSEVRSRHVFTVHTDEAQRFAARSLGWQGDRRVEECIGALLTANSKQTMEAIRTALRADVALS
jgi:aromatase